MRAVFQITSRGRLVAGWIALGMLAAVACAPAASAPATATSAPASATTAPAAAQARPTTVPAAASNPTSVPPAAPIATPSGPAAHVRYANTTGAAVSSPVYIAMERGYFQQAGIDLEVVNFAGGAQMIPSIAASQVDVANTDTGAGLLNAISRDLPMRFVADGSQCNKQPCQTAFLVRKALLDSGGFKSIADLKGKKVNTFTPGSSLNQFLYRMMDQASLQEPDLDLQNVSFDQVLPAMSTGAIDASWDIEPFTTQGIAQGIVGKFADSYDFFGPTEGTVIVYSPGFATQQPEVGRRFMVAYLRGVRDYVDAFVNGKDQDAIVAILTKDTSLTDPTLFKKVALPEFDPNGRILLDSVKTSQQWYVDHQIVKTPVDIDSVYDQSYLTYALGVLGTR